MFSKKEKSVWFTRTDVTDITYDTTKDNTLPSTVFVTYSLRFFDSTVSFSTSFCLPMNKDSLITNLLRF